MVSAIDAFLILSDTSEVRYITPPPKKKKSIIVKKKNNFLGSLSKICILLPHSSFGDVESEGIFEKFRNVAYA